ncbi:hypothetical protein SISNIDRAFT_466735 [Sistotremastrum niveocremeum HHB9708]|uniref:Uncharacterized protein n=1 Tax=Sistotremastrum niveocremeum HHB9708 TaxID=1314777 RepID=A0A164TFF0_9AGAM|nr:hypothetical protein SISNIDRAFT_466735 [Sistotremastrum niveocremeum HHB9708]
MLNNPRDSFLRLTDESCYAVPGSAIDFQPRTDVSGPQTQLLSVLNSLCDFNHVETKTQLERLIFAPNATALAEQAQSGNSDCPLTSPHPLPITLLVWDRPSNQELSRPAFKVISIRHHPGLPILLFELFRICELSTLGLRTQEPIWRKHGERLYYTDLKHLGKITAVHISECVHSTTLLSAAFPAFEKSAGPPPVSLRKRIRLARRLLSGRQGRRKKVSKKSNKVLAEHRLVSLSLRRKRGRGKDT